MKRLFYPSERISLTENEMPTCTIIVAAYNESLLIEKKIQNTLSLKYPAGKLKVIFVTDGSSDRTPEMVAQYSEITLLHANERKGKIAAVQRAIAKVDTDIIVFTDANTFLNPEALLLICRNYGDPKVGGVAGEKRVIIDTVADATAGEGFYWKYESKLKAWDSELYSTIGAAGELFSIRKYLYEPIPLDSILDDFMISMRIAEKNYTIKYEPEAFAYEDTSANVKEEMKRKIRIAAGGIQSIIWLKNLLNPFKFPLLSFQYFSHRVLRWTITPILMLVVVLLNILIVSEGAPPTYKIILCLQMVFYFLAFLGKIMEDRQISVKILFIPYYFCVMNYAVLAGIIRFFSGGQSVIWEKSIRK